MGSKSDFMTLETFLTFNDPKHDYFGNTYIEFIADDVALNTDLL